MKIPVKEAPKRDKLLRLLFGRWNSRFRIIAKYAKGDIIDVGCVQSYNAYLPKGITGFDIEEYKGGGDRYSKFVRGDAHHLSRYFKKKFDTVIASCLIEHLDNPVKFLKECNKTLKMGGILIIATDNPYRLTTMIANVVFPKGRMSSVEHNSYFPPRNLNTMARRMGFEVMHVKPASGFRIPFTNLEWVYIYKKKREIKG
jgi:SAM-dependent methyltransferase